LVPTKSVGIPDIFPVSQRNIFSSSSSQTFPVVSALTVKTPSILMFAFCPAKERIFISSFPSFAFDSHTTLTLILFSSP